MKRAIALSLISAMLVLSACSPSETEETPAGENGSSEQSPDSSEKDNQKTDGLEVKSETLGESEVLYYDISRDELLEKLNEKMVEGGYAEFTLKESFLGENEDSEDAYHYVTEGKTSHLSISEYHGNAKVSHWNVKTFDAKTEDQIALTNYIIESMIDISAPGQTESIAGELGIYEVGPDSEFETRSYVYGDSNFQLSVSDEFMIRPEDQ